MLKYASTTVRPVEESKTLTEKYDAQVKWMHEKGITGSLSDSDRMPARRAPEKPAKRL